MPTGAVAAVNVKGLKELNRALKFADKETREGIQHAFRQLAVPVQLEAQRLAVTEISGLRRTNLKSGGEWGLMRIAINQKLVYVAPFRRGKKKGSQKRRNFAGLLMDKAMQPALDKNAAKIEKAAEDVLENMSDNFNRGTP